MLDPETTVAIVASVNASTAGNLPGQRKGILDGTFDSISEAMSQGEGAFFFNFTTHGGAGASTPSHAAATERSSATTQRIRSLVTALANKVASQTPPAEDGSSARVTIIYVPPTEASTTEIATEQSMSVETIRTVDIQV